MYNPHYSIYGNLFLTGGVGLAIGLIVGYPGWLLSASLLFWALLQARQFIRLQRWLMRSERSELPESTGHWGELFDELAREQKRNKTRNQSLRRMIARFQESSAALSDAIVIIDNHNNLEWWNRAADRLLGLKAQTDRGHSVMNLLRDPRFIRYYRKQNYSEPLQLPSPVDSSVALEYQLTLFGVGNRILVARDITRINQLEQTRQDFVANASHELRTPLTVIRGYLETFLDQDLPKPLQRGLRQMESQSRRMENLVADLLLLSRLEASPHISDELPITLPALIGRIHEDARALGQDKQHQFELHLDPLHGLLGQEAEIYSAFSNLVFNAVRYTQAHGTIRIRWWTDNNGAHFSVSDNGPGIDSIHLSRLPERFYRVDESRSSDSGGTGLGLAIVKHVMMRHNGRLTIQSEPGKGSTFSCHFPVELITRLQPQDSDELHTQDAPVDADRSGN